MIQTSTELKGTLRATGKIHRVTTLGSHFIVLCRGFLPMQGEKLSFTDSKPNCKACLKIKNIIGE